MKILDTQTVFVPDRKKVQAVLARFALYQSYSQTMWKWTQEPEEERNPTLPYRLLKAIAKAPSFDIVDLNHIKQNTADTIFCFIQKMARPRKSYPRPKFESQKSLDIMADEKIGKAYDNMAACLARQQNYIKDVQRNLKKIRKLSTDERNRDLIKTLKEENKDNLWCEGGCRDILRESAQILYTTFTTLMSLAMKSSNFYLKEALKSITAKTPWMKRLDARLVDKENGAMAERFLQSVCATHTFPVLDGKAWNSKYEYDFPETWVDPVPPVTPPDNLKGQRVVVNGTSGGDALPITSKPNKTAKQKLAFQDGTVGFGYRRTRLHKKKWGCFDTEVEKEDDI